MLVNNPFEELVELLKKLLETIGLSKDPSEEGNILFALLQNALNNDLVEEFLEAIGQSGKSKEDVLRSVIIDHSRELLKEFVLSWIEMQKPVKELLDAVYAVQKEALDEVCRILMDLVARKMTSAEIIEAKKIYGNTFDYDSIYFSIDGPVNDVVFAVQDFINQKPASYAFVTFKMVNHDVDDGPLTNRTMIHELCHVWQFQDAGPVYMIQAIHAQTLGDGYNYGYTNPLNGNGGAADIQKKFTDNSTKTVAEVFELFNREQQAQIIMHYYQRRYVESPALNFAAWQPFQDLVYTP